MGLSLEWEKGGENVHLEREKTSLNEFSWAGSGSPVALVLSAVPSAAADSVVAGTAKGFRLIDDDDDDDEVEDEKGKPKGEMYRFSDKD